MWVTFIDLPYILFALATTIPHIPAKKKKKKRKWRRWGRPREARRGEEASGCVEGKRKRGPDGRTGRDPWFRGKKKKRNRKYYYYFGGRKGRRRKWKMLRQKCRDTMTNERARARALCMNEYDRNTVSLLSKLFKKGGKKLVSALGKWKEEFDSFSGQKRGGRRGKKAGGRQISMT